MTYNKTYLFIASIILIIAVIGYAYIDSLNNEITRWKNEYVQVSSMLKTSDSTYSSLIRQVEDINIANQYLKDNLSDSKRKAVYYNELYATYKFKYDSIKTRPADTAIVYWGEKIDSTDRLFDQWLNNELYISGYFNTIYPYLLHMKEIQLKTKLSILVSQDKDELWYWDINTSSKYLKIDSSNVQIKPFVKNKWEYFISSNIKMNYDKIVGYGVSGGLKYKTYGIGVGGSVLFKQNPYYEISFYKFGTF